MTTYFLLGGDLQVNRLGYGAMRLSDDPTSRPADQAHIWRAPVEREAAVALLRRAVELGVNLIDTADAYTLGGNEELVAEALHPYRESVAVATKVGVARPGPTEWVPLGRPEYLRQQAELSLRRLRVERIDLLQLHAVDPTVPLADQVGALKQLRDEGKVRHIGLSKVSVEQLAEAAQVTPIAAVQNMYNLVAREDEDVVDYAAANDIAYLPFFPIAMGGHTGSGSPLAGVASEVGATPAQTMLAWLLRRSPTTIPIPGTTSLAHLEENLGALSVKLSDEQYERLSALS
ncbi:aldo/keto reductase [Nonomuraea sp. NPDC002799]